MRAVIREQSAQLVSQRTYDQLAGLISALRIDEQIHQDRAPARPVPVLAGIMCPACGGVNESDAERFACQYCKQTIAFK